MDRLTLPVPEFSTVVASHTEAVSVKIVDIIFDDGTRYYLQTARHLATNIAFTSGYIVMSDETCLLPPQPPARYPMLEQYEKTGSLVIPQALR